MTKMYIGLHVKYSTVILAIF